VDAGGDAGEFIDGGVVEPIGELRGSSCLCAEVPAQRPSSGSPLALLALLAMGFAFARRRD
jgi:MYXO-CTERM domain-containing protein